MVGENYQTARRRPPIGIASGSSILIGRNLVGGVQPDVSQPISLPALAPPPVQSRVCPGYRIERTELRAAGGADSRFARIKLRSPWRNRNCPDSINWFNKRAVGRGWHAIRLLRCSRTLRRGSGVLLSTNRLLFWSRGFGLGNRGLFFCANGYFVRRPQPNGTWIGCWLKLASEKNLTDDPNDPINRENAALDRMVKGICRGC